MADQPDFFQHAIDDFITSITDIRYTQMTAFVAATIVIYDYIVCIEREVELIWKKRRSMIKLAFLWHRYFGLAVVLFQAYALNATGINDKFCSFWFFWETWGYCAVLFTSEAVLLLWIYVVYNKNRYILAVMGGCYVAEIASVVAILVVSFKNYEARAHGIPGLEYCVLTQIGSPFPLLWVPILAYQSLLLLLFVYRGCAGASPTPRCRLAWRYDSLLDMIYRHSLLNFLAIFASYLACATIWLTSSLGLYQIPVAFAVSLSITNCTRLLINIRRAYYPGVSDPVFYSVRRAPSGPDLRTGARAPRPSRPMRPPPLLLQDERVPMSPLSPHSPLTPLTPMSAFSNLSGATLRDMSATPTSTLRALSPRSLGVCTPTISLRDRVATSSPSSTLRTRVLGPAHTLTLTPSPSAETLRVPPALGPAISMVSRPGEAAPRHAHEYVRARPGMAHLPRLVVPEQWRGLREADVRASVASYVGHEIFFGEAV